MNATRTSKYVFHILRISYGFREWKRTGRESHQKRNPLLDWVRERVQVLFISNGVVVIERWKRCQGVSENHSKPQIATKWWTLSLLNLHSPHLHALAIVPIISRIFYSNLVALGSEQFEVRREVFSPKPQVYSPQRNPKWFIKFSELCMKMRVANACFGNLERAYGSLSFFWLSFRF